jgi:hypothetical protein
MEENFQAECRSLRYKTAPSAKEKLKRLEEEYPGKVQRVKEKLATDLKEKDEQMLNYYKEVCVLVQKANATAWPRCDFVKEVISEIPDNLFASFTSSR